MSDPRRREIWAEVIELDTEKRALGERARLIGEQITYLMQEFIVEDYEPETRETNAEFWGLDEAN